MRSPKMENTESCAMEIKFQKGSAHLFLGYLKAWEASKTGSITEVDRGLMVLAWATILVTRTNNKAATLEI